MWAKINHGELTVSDVQLYLNDVKVYDGVPVGPEPFVVWSVGAYCEPDTEYDWKVTATVDGDVWTSAIWTFTTAEKKANLRLKFVWCDSGGPYDIYFGTDPDNLDLMVEDWVEPEWDYDGPPLDYGTEYWWRIDDGPPFNFETMPLYPPQWQTKTLRLVAAANNRIWYEDI
jgi:hypothetical protein